MTAIPDDDKTGEEAKPPAEPQGAEGEAKPDDAAGGAAAKPDDKPAEKPARKRKPRSAKAADAKTDAGKQPPDADAKAGADKASKAPEKPAKGSSSGIGGVFWTLLFLAALVGGGYASLPIWGPKLAEVLPGSQARVESQERLQAVTERVTALERKAEAAAGGEPQSLAALQAERERVDDRLKVLIGRVEGLEAELAGVQKMAEATASPAEAADTSDSIRRLSARLSHVEKNTEALNDLMARVAKIEERTKETKADTALGDSVADLKARLSAIESADIRAGRAQGLVLAVTRLREATSRAQPFEPALAAVEALAKDNPDLQEPIAVLKAQAATGIATIDMLEQEFADVSDDILRAAPEADGSGWAQQALHRVRGLVKVRRVDEGAPPDSAGGAVARAETSLMAGDLEAATEALKALDGPAREAAAPWLARAEARIAAERALAALHVQAMALMAPAEPVAKE